MNRPGSLMLVHVGPDWAFPSDGGGEHPWHLLFISDCHIYTNPLWSRVHACKEACESSSTLHSLRNSNLNIPHQYLQKPLLFYVTCCNPLELLPPLILLHIFPPETGNTWSKQINDKPNFSRFFSEVCFLLLPRRLVVRKS